MTQTREVFAVPASEETIQRVAQRIRERNIEVVVVDDGDQARKVVLERLPEGAEVRFCQVPNAEGCRHFRYYS